MQVEKNASWVPLSSNDLPLESGGDPKVRKMKQKVPTARDAFEFYISPENGGRRFLHEQFPNGCDCMGTTYEADWESGCVVVRFLMIEGHEDAVEVLKKQDWDDIDGFAGHMLVMCATQMQHGVKSFVMYFLPEAFRWSEEVSRE